MTYLYLLGAIFAEVIATSLLKNTEGFSRLRPTVVCLIGYAVSFALLAASISRNVQTDVAYALWSAIGTALIVLGAVLFLGGLPSLFPTAIAGLMCKHRCNTGGLSPAVLPATPSGAPDGRASVTRCGEATLVYAHVVSGSRTHRFRTIDCHHGLAEFVGVRKLSILEAATVVGIAVSRCLTRNPPTFSRRCAF